jgi:hypothetical protein
MTIQEIKKEKQRKYDQLLTDCKVFFAFSDEQFHKNKTPLAEGDKYVSIGAGGYVPKSMVQALSDGMKAINKEYKAAIKNHKQRDANILYELRNHEAFYTNDIEETLEALGSDYSRSEVMAVFNANASKEREHI